MNDRLDYIDWNVALYALMDNGEPMSWNLLLALIPLVLSCYLFHLPRSLVLRWSLWIALGVTVAGSYPRILPILVRLANGSGLAIALGLGIFGIGLWRFLGRQRFKPILWWLGCLVCLLFLPNAAYILTDLIHLILDIRKGYPIGVVMFGLMPQYLLFIGVGFAAYVLSIMNVGFYLRDRGLSRYIMPTEITIHLLSAIGIYLGRFDRMNSWDVIGDSTALAKGILNMLTSTHALLVIAVTFLVLAITYALSKFINLGLLLQSQDLKRP
ncbi:protein of unknown function DUF1361 [Thalassoporum mexicanum PCC 7367]|uniref:DUF1361 domain-containing protein n=1 Tax=Thalassoporum mexicanum TaxID=3457544 RepID=UPI00029FC88D|nr:DUF1361 domain-containing protein [Pseudanabaena sp. PCC 7367]AFY68784.1 protein of unknown function DUF1361 [Pseudanabaena sp. PCC 7367]